MSKAHLEKIFYSMAESSDLAVVVADAGCKVKWINPAFTKMCGYSLDEIKNTKPGKLLQGEDTNPETIKSLHHAMEKKKECCVDILNYHKNGEKYWAHIRISPVCDKKGKLINFVAIEKKISAHAVRHGTKCNRMASSLCSVLLKTLHVCNGKKARVHVQPE
ncbi:MAG: PAS domain-containing protein [Verrucomicrobiota bacterium]|nr:PAS domain-containing protein [Verrucomicrobiota bacterium]